VVFLKFLLYPIKFLHLRQCAGAVFVAYFLKKIMDHESTIIFAIYKKLYCHYLKCFGAIFIQYHNFGTAKADGKVAWLIFCWFANTMNLNLLHDAWIKIKTWLKLLTMIRFEDNLLHLLNWKFLCQWWKNEPKLSLGLLGFILFFVVDVLVFYLHLCTLNLYSYCTP